MKIHEHQAKEILARHGVPVPRGEVAYTPDQARQIAERIGCPVVLKAQVHAGGRGKAGGIRLAQTPDEAAEIARQMLGTRLVTHQTGPEGKPVHRLLVEETLPVERELYLGITLDRSIAKNVFMASSAGGVEIEEVAREHPELLLKEALEPGLGLLPFQARKLAYGMGLPQALIRPVTTAMMGLAEAYHAVEASLAEINPLVITTHGQVYALDAKINLDDNALFRHPELAQLRDVEQEEPLEVEASKYRLNYIKLDGNIGCMVNGAGLAMATMDIIKYAGGNPANFLDVGGGADVEQIRNAFRILISDPNVKAVLINIFGGILRCDRLAQGVVEAARDLDIRIPIVVRMEGTNVELGRKILQESGLNFTVAEDMKTAAEMVVRLAQ